MTTKQDFFRTYDSLAEDGHCNVEGGAEYRRVLAEWLDAGQPEPHAAFIRKRANFAPCGDEPACQAEAETFMAEHVDPLIEEQIDEILRDAADDAT
jgi:hypothetical protein